MEALKRLPLAKIQQFISAELLDRLEQFAPLFQTEEINKDSIYSKDNLINILKTFEPQDLGKNNEFLASILIGMDPDQLTQVSGIFSIKDTSNQARAVKEIVKKCSSTAKRNLLLRAIGFPEAISDRASEVSALSCIEPDPEPFKRIKQYQHGVFAEALNELQSPSSRFIIQMPTGSGKTRTAIEIISECLNEYRSEGNIAIIWLAHSEELCHQASGCFEAVWRHVGRKKVNLLRLWGNNNIGGHFSDDPYYIVASLQKIHSMTRMPDLINQIKSRSHLVVIDEAHKTIAPTYKSAIESICKLNTRVIGLTATPGRNMNDLYGNKELSDFYNNKKIEIQCPHKKGVLPYLRQQKVLSQAVYRPLITDIEFMATAAEQRNIEKNGDFSKKFVQAVGNNDLRNILIIEEIKKYIDNGHKIIFFGCSVDHSIFICSILKLAGIKSAHVDGSTSKDRRRTIINDYSHGEYQVICNFGVLTTGFDDPKTDLVFISRPTQSVVLYSQMIGRGLRGPKLGGTKKCIIANVIDNIEGLPDNDEIYGFFDGYFE